MTIPRIAGALTVLAALALPAAAAAHPSVYTDANARVEDPQSPGTYIPQTRYVVANHGFTYVLRETNGVASADHRGLFDYKAMPEGLTAGKTFSELRALGSSGAQPHAMCRVPQLETDAAITGWQDDPFYAYVPFQKEAAGLDDDPADWIAHVQALTGVDLATVADPRAACEALDGGTGVYVPADATQSSNAQFNAGLITHTTEPLEARIRTLATALSGETDARNALQALLDAARAQIAQLTVAATPITATLPSARLQAGRGAKVALSGPAGARVTVALTIAEGRARKLKLPSSVLATRRATLAADGTATVTLAAGRSARKALRKLASPIAVRVTARAGDRIATATGTLTR